MEASPSSSFEVAEPDLLLEFLVVTLDAPAEFGQIDEASEANVAGQARKPVLGRLFLAFGPFDEQPFFRPGLTAIEVAPGDANTQAGKARSERRIGALAPGDRSPRLGRQAEGQLFELDRPMRRIAAQPLGRPPAT